MNHRRVPEPDAPAPDGEYMAYCKEKSLLLAGANGHSAIFPQAQCLIGKGEAVFYRCEEVIWTCNAVYATAHFLLEPR